MTIYEQLKSAGVPMDHHESDLYCRCTDEAREIVSRYEHRGNVGTFDHRGELWYDIPFAYDPWWADRQIPRFSRLTKARPPE